MIINGQPEDIATPLSVDELITRKGLTRDAWRSR